MRVALYGGAFDPPHVGHVAVISALCTSPEFDEVWIVPSSNERYDKKALAPAASRLRWLDKLLTPELTGDRFVRVERAEIDGLVKGDGTIALIDFLKERHPEYDFSVCIGSELVSSLGQWKDAERIAAEANFTVIPRKGAPPPNPGNFHITMLEPAAPIPEISSTAIRELLRSGHSIANLVPESLRAEVELCPAYTAG